MATFSFAGLLFDREGVFHSNVLGFSKVLDRKEGLVVSNLVMRYQTHKESIQFDPAWWPEKEGTESDGKGKEGTGRKQVETERAPGMGSVGLGKELLKGGQGEESGAVKEQVEALPTKKGEGRKPPAPDVNKPGGKKRVQFEDVEMTDDMRARESMEEYSDRSDNKSGCEEVAEVDSMEGGDLNDEEELEQLVSTAVRMGMGQTKKLTECVQSRVVLEFDEHKISKEKVVERYASAVKIIKPGTVLLFAMMTEKFTEKFSGEKVTFMVDMGSELNICLAELFGWDIMGTEGNQWAAKTTIGLH
ncbi:hypothetical protein C0995_016227 [Termitomyces sp. Mi166|nr:hypothetical protein C0995_016227 [Termitomyces sp. Mi166\